MDHLIIKWLMKEELKPENPYAISKIKTENYLLENEKYFKFIILRYFNVAGAILI